MRVWFSRLLLVAALALIAPESGVVSAETVGGFTFTAPEGWEACKQDFGFTNYYCNAKGGIIGIQSPATAADAKTLAHQDLEGIEIVNEQETVFAGKAGHMVIGRLKQGDKYILVAIAATTDAGGARIGLIAAPEIVESSVAQWGALIDQGSFGGAAAPTQTFTVQNVGEGCTATAMIDGQSIEIAAGGKQEIKLTEGKHEFTWVDSQGVQHSATADVPPADTLGAACVAGGAAPQPNNPGQEALPPATSSDKAMFDGARAAVKFYRTLGNLVLGTNLLDPTPKSDRPMLRVLAERPDDKLGTIQEYTGYLQALETAMGAAQADPTKMSALRRWSLMVMAQAGQIGGVSQSCSSKGDQAALMDCVMDEYAKDDPRNVVAEWGRTFARIGNAPNPADAIAQLASL